MRDPNVCYPRRLGSFESGPSRNDNRSLDLRVRLAPPEGWGFGTHLPPTQRSGGPERRLQPVQGKP